MSHAIVQELQDALDWQEMPTIEKIAINAESSVDWRGIKIPLSLVQNQEILNLFANNALNTIWSSDYYLDFVFTLPEFSQWLVTNKAHCLDDQKLFNYHYSSKPGFIKVAE